MDWKPRAYTAAGALDSLRGSGPDSSRSGSSGGRSRFEAPGLFSNLLKRHRSRNQSNMSLRKAQQTDTVEYRRQIFNQKQFNDQHHVSPRPRKNMTEAVRSRWAKLACSGECVRGVFITLFPFVGVMRDYKWRHDLVPDMVAGFTVGIMNIPQGMAYALLAGLPPIFGLYVSLFPVVFYYFFGTSRHVAMGTFAVVSLMVSSVLDTVVDGSSHQIYTQTANLTSLQGDNLTTFWHNYTDWSGNGSDVDNFIDAAAAEEAITTKKIQVAVALTFSVGVWQILLGVLRLGFVTIYLADPLIKGFTTGAACHVCTSQIRFVLGISVSRFTGPFKLIKTYIDLFSKITQVVPAEIVISFTCIIILILVKECINARYREKMKMPVPIELILVVALTVASYFGKFAEDFGVQTVGKVPVGLPVPTIPSVGEYFSQTLASSFSIAIVGFAISVSLAKIFAKRNNYEVDSNQELLAYGLMNLLSSFFFCFPSSASLSRSLIQENSGARSQVAALFQSLLVLIVILVIGPYFETLPNSTLAAIIIVAMKGMFKQLFELPDLWRISKYDFAIWMVSFLAVVITDVDLGLIIAVAFGMLTVVFRTQYPYTCIMARVKGTDLYKDREVYKESAEEIDGIKIFRIDASLYYANVEHFRERLYKLTEVNPRQVKMKRNLKEHEVEVDIHRKKKELYRERRRAQKDGTNENELSKQEKGLSQSEEEATDVTAVAASQPDWPKVSIHHIVLDCSMMSYVDSVGVNMLVTIYNEYKEIRVGVSLANCKGGVSEMFVRSGFYEKVPLEQLFVSIHDAVIRSLDAKDEVKLKVEQDTKIVSRPRSSSLLIVSRPRSSSLLGERPHFARSGSMIEKPKGRSSSFRGSLRVKNLRQIPPGTSSPPECPLGDVPDLPPLSARSPSGPTDACVDAMRNSLTSQNSTGKGISFNSLESPRPPLLSQSSVNSDVVREATTTTTHHV